MIVNLLKQTQTIITNKFFIFIIQIIVLSGAFTLLFDAFWSATIFLPISVAVELLIKMLLTQVFHTDG